MSILLVIITAIAMIGMIGLTAGILMLVAPSLWEKLNERANAILISTAKIVPGKLTLVAIVFILLSLYVLWSAYTLLKLTC
jgi:hypothetical protein